MNEKSPKKKIPQEGKYAIHNENDSDSDEDDNIRTSAKMLSAKENFTSSPV